MQEYIGTETIEFVRCVGCATPLSLKITWKHSMTHLSETLCIVCASMCANQVQPLAFGVSLNLNLPSSSPWSLFNGTWPKRPGELDHDLRFEIDERILQMQQAVNLTNENESISRVTGWRRPTGCLKLQVFSAKEPLIMGFFCVK